MIFLEVGRSEVRIKFLLINGLRKRRRRKGDISRVFIFYAYMLHG
jgi:hypothetical protein